MAKFDFDIAVAFGLQAGEGEANYNDALDALTTTLVTDETPGADSQGAGLLLGDPESGVRQSGLTLTLGRRLRDKAFLGSSFTRSLSDFLAADVPTFTFAFPFRGLGQAASGPPVDADMDWGALFPALDALLKGAGMVGAADGGGVGHAYTFNPGDPISALVYINGIRLELADCRCSLSIEYTPGSIAVCTATVEVGSVKDESTYTPGGLTLNYNEQASVSSPSLVSMANLWQDTRGFSTGTLAITPEFGDIPDSNAATAIVKEQTDRIVEFSGVLFADDSGTTDYEYNQLIETIAGNLDPLSFQAGLVASGTLPVLGHKVLLATPELIDFSGQALGTKAAREVTLRARGSGSGDNELTLTFN